MAMFDRLPHRAREIDSLLCVGLDPRFAADERVTTRMLTDANRRVVEATASFALCYKPNIAFYEQYGPAGLEALHETVALIPDEIPVILDAKRGDIGATAEAYAAAYGRGAQGLGVDAITVSPYMGPDSVEPFTRAGLAVFVLCRTSNPGASRLQDRLTDGAPFYRTVAREASGWPGEVGLVVAGNDLEALRRLRVAHPDIWFLSPGIGAQGGSMEDAMAAGLRADGLGILPVVARGIAAADDPGAAARGYVEALRRARDEAMDAGPPAAGPPATEPSVTRGLVDAILDTGCFRTGEFTLKSGAVSPFYIDLRRLQSDPLALESAAKAYEAMLRSLTADRIAAIPVAALPLATALALRVRMPLVYPRLPVKPHGTGNRVEGDFNPGERAVLVDDLITTGGSKLEAASVLREGGLVVEDLLVLIDRGNAAARAELAEAGIALHAALDIDGLVARALERGLVSPEDAARVTSFLRADSQRADR